MASRVEVDWRKFASHRERLGRIKEGFNTSRGRAFIEEIKALVAADTRAAMLEGLDKDGQPFEPVTPETMKRRGGSGPPLAPHGVASRVVSRFIAESVVTEGRVEIVVGWQGGDMEYLIYHARGAGRLPVRNTLGIRPATREKVKASLRRFRDDLVRGNA